MPDWFINRGATASLHEGELRYGFPFVGLVAEVGMPLPALPYGIVQAQPAMGRMIEVSSDGTAINLAAVIKGSHLTEAEDWLLYCTSPAIPWKISDIEMPRVQHPRGITIKASSPRAAVVGALEHHATNSRYSIAAQLAKVIGRDPEVTISYDILIAYGHNLKDFPYKEFQSAYGQGTLTMVGRDIELT